MNKIVRSITYFTANPQPSAIQKIKECSAKLTSSGFEIQTLRVCTSLKNIREFNARMDDGETTLGVGSLTYEEAVSQLSDFYQVRDVHFNVDLTSLPVEKKHIDLIFRIINEKPGKTFNFAYVFNNKPSSPFFPSAAYEREGFSLGFQPTNLSEGCQTLGEWFTKMKEMWAEVYSMFRNDRDFIGLDSSTAPIFSGKGSLVNFTRRLGLSFSQSVISDIYLQITEFITKENPRPAGLCGLMLPCLEDFELAEEYEEGNFPIERNLYLSLNSGLGIDTYPVGVDEKLERVLEILLVIQGLSNKYQKPLSVRLVSDGRAKIGERTDFNNQYLKDVVVRPL